MKQEIPFRFNRLSPTQDDPFYPNRIISSMDECGVFLCTGGEVQVSLEGEVYQIRRGDMYIYMPSSPVRLLYKSDDAEGLLVALDVDFMLSSPRYFSTIIKEKSGTNALQWIVQIVIAEAKLLLETSELSIKEISAHLNFPTQSFFGKYFKQYTGVSPKDYRESVLKEK